MQAAYNQQYVTLEQTTSNAENASDDGPVSVIGDEDWVSAGEGLGNGDGDLDGAVASGSDDAEMGSACDQSGLEL